MYALLFNRWVSFKSTHSFERKDLLNSFTGCLDNKRFRIFRPQGGLAQTFSGGHDD